MELLFTALASIVIGSLLGFILWKLARKHVLARAQNEAQELVQEAKDQFEIEELHRQEKLQEIEGSAWTKVENEMLKLEEKIEDLQESADEKKLKSDQQYALERQKSTDREKLIQYEESRIQSLQSKFDQILNSHKDRNLNYIKALCERLKVTPEQIKTEIATQILNEAQEYYRQLLENNAEEIKDSAETRAKTIIDIAIDRFARPYSSERGIGAAHFPDPQAKQNLCDPEGLNLKKLQELSGCDLYIQEESDLVGVAGFDPVRRELTRRTLERLFKEKKKIDPATVQRIFENQKRELFKQIKSDGDAIARELKIDNLHPEIRQMMGSLRFRYSFTQNQYFHCAEVGWLCGLLASEVKADLKVARRSGLLHDIGKSMDHALDGSHAVIGANFIAERGESPEVIHNVRAHHYDEQPNTDIAYLVIAADAISGARPGARRSTIESYNQKVTELQDIARSFEGVNDAYVLSGGRELRVFVNSKKVDDHKSLEISKKIAARVEEECSYPGQIKIVIVRETAYVESHQRAHA